MSERVKRPGAHDGDGGPADAADVSPSGPGPAAATTPTRTRRATQPDARPDRPDDGPGLIRPDG
jgi:hypothetical protein